MAVCPDCGREIPGEYEFCGYCGRARDETFVTGFQVSSATTSAVAGTTDFELSSGGSLSLQHRETGRQVLCTLWDLQKTQFGGRADDRAGFRLSSVQAGEAAVRRALRELSFKGLVSRDEEGVYFLTDHGLSYCDEELSCVGVERFTVG